MEFNGQYLTYEEYQGLGGTIPRTPFNLLEYGARKKIDEKTQFRLKNVNSAEIPQEVKICDYYLLEKINKYAKQDENIITDSQSIASESTDGYNVSYNNITIDKVVEILNSKNAELNDIAYTYLLGCVFNGEHIIYNGVK